MCRTIKFLYNVYTYDSVVGRGYKAALYSRQYRVFAYCTMHSFTIVRKRFLQCKNTYSKANFEASPPRNGKEFTGEDSGKKSVIFFRFSDVRLIFLNIAYQFGAKTGHPLIVILFFLWEKVNTFFHIALLP